MVTREQALEYHAHPVPGKVEVRPTKPTATQDDLSLAYSPGVAEPCRVIADRPDAVFDYTARGNLVAVISNGTAVLGLGNIGPLASKPVMEGKGVLFKRFAGVDVFDIEVDAEDVDHFCSVVKAIAPTFGGINLEDIKAPQCFEIEARLRRELDIPVFHDDQHGTAIISAAGVVNAMKLSGKDIGACRFVFSGAGAAAIATARLMLEVGATKENILLCDSKGVVRKGDPRIAGNPTKEEFAADTDRTTLAEALDGADVFIGVSVGGLVTQDMVRSMAAHPVIFALANPDPEIPYDEALAARPDAIVATGRSDYPNQVNNVLGFPFLFRGALDVRAKGINEAMKIAAVHALADLAREEVEDSVAKVYEGSQLEFGSEYVIPKPFDSRVLLRVAPAVAQAAMDSGIARRPIDDMDAYRERLERFLGKKRELLRFAITRAREDRKRVVLADGENPVVIRAAAQLLEEGICKPVLIGRRDVIGGFAEEHALELGLDAGRSEVHATETSPLRPELEAVLYRLRCRKGMTQHDVRRAIRNRVYFGGMLVRAGFADGMVAGLGGTFPETLRPALRSVGRRPEQTVRAAGVHLMVVNNELMFFADTTMTEHAGRRRSSRTSRSTRPSWPAPSTVAPRVAMLSASNFGSVGSASAQLMRDATARVRELAPDLQVDGEMHADMALLAEQREKLFPFSTLKGAANVLIFPSLDAGNIAQKVAQCCGAETSIGPILVGLDHPVNILNPYAEVGDVVMTATLTAMMAVARGATDRCRV